jgi:Mycothiol maleylpyruvate isomerase N-terminal domain
MADEAAIRELDEAYLRARCVLAELDAAALDLPTDNSGWTVRNLAAHIATGASIVTMSAPRLADGKGLSSLPVPNWLGNKIGDMFNKRTVKNHAQDGVAELLGLIDSEQQRALAALAEVPDSGWNKRGAIPGIGRVTLAELVRVYARHYDDHLAVLKKAITSAPGA